MKSSIASRQTGRREKILDATLALIAEGGVDSVSHRRVAEAARVPLGSTTYYFESREHLLREAFGHYLNQAKALHADVLNDRPMASTDDLVAYLIDLTEREFEDQSLLLAEYELTLFAARDEVIAEQLHHWDGGMVGDIASAMRKLGATAPRDAAWTVLHLMRGYELDCLTRRKSAGSAPFKRRLKTVIAAFVNG